MLTVVTIQNIEELILLCIVVNTRTTEFAIQNRAGITDTIYNM